MNKIPIMNAEGVQSHSPGLAMRSKQPGDVGQNPVRTPKVFNKVRSEAGREYGNYMNQIQLELN